MRWRRARVRFLEENPLCEMCKPMLTPSVIVDHRIPHRGDQALFWDESNWQALCKDCHDGPKQGEERLGYSRQIDPASGFPIDPRHPFNR